MPQLTEISKHLRIAKLAIELHEARGAARLAKDVYRDVLDHFQCFIDDTPRVLDPRDENCAEIIAYSKDAYKAHQAAKRKVYNAQRRLDNACRQVTV